MSYKYITDNNLYSKQTYMYSDYEGLSFISKYLGSRKVYLEQNKKTGECVSETAGKDGSPTQRNLREILYQLDCGHNDEETICAVNNYVKSFEVRKRIYTNYDGNWKPSENAGFEEYECYLLFADCLISMYDRTHCLKYYSCLLKLDDTLLSIQNKLGVLSKEHLGRIIMRELEIFKLLADRYGICQEG